MAKTRKITRLPCPLAPAIREEIRACRTFAQLRDALVLHFPDLVGAALAASPFVERLPDRDLLAQARLTAIAGLTDAAFSRDVPISHAAPEGMRTNFTRDPARPVGQPGWRATVGLCYVLPRRIPSFFTSALFEAVRIHLGQGAGHTTALPDGMVRIEGAFQATFFAADFLHLPVEATSAHEALAMREPGWRPAA